MDSIKALFKKLIIRHRYSRCYTRNEYTGKAVFLMCECDDMNCPFNIKTMDVQNKNGFAVNKS